MPPDRGWSTGARAELAGVSWIAIDWGTTNRRAYLLDGDGAVLDELSDAAGVLTVPPDGYPAAIAALRERLGAYPIVAAGMIGSDRGLATVPYVDAPADLAAIAAGAVEAMPGVHLVPGVALRHGGRADVMRGEEVQVLGAVAAGLFEPDAFFCQPGTHSKWIAVENAAITDCWTALTGELFALLRGQGTLSGMLDADTADGPAFRAGVERGAGAADLLTALFEVRASVLLGQRSRSDAASYASGLLIGNDAGARSLTDLEVALIAEGPLADLYAVAITLRGGAVRRLDSRAGFLAGVTAVARALGVAI